MRAGDLDRVVPLADTLFPDHLEDAAYFAERLERGGVLCLTLAADDSARIAGYAIAYPWPLDHIPPLNRPLTAPSAASGAIYLHDLGVHPEVSGAGHAGAALALLRERARASGASAIALVAVSGSAGFWEARGFAAQPVSTPLAAKLASYGTDARYLVARL
jgi:ribosomal protein S18 acetylase RimI-like enzyme